MEKGVIGIIFISLFILFGSVAFITGDIPPGEECTGPFCVTEGSEGGGEGGEATCSDTDGGKIYSAKGTCNDASDFTPVDDECTDSNTLKEYFCSVVDLCGIESKTCDGACVDGACVAVTDTNINCDGAACVLATDEQYPSQPVFDNGAEACDDVSMSCDFIEVSCHNIGSTAVSWSRSSASCSAPSSNYPSSCVYRAVCEVSSETGCTSDDDCANVCDTSTGACVECVSIADCSAASGETCVSGSCVADTGCVDEDGGEDYDVKGNCIDSIGTYEERCITGDILREYYCGEDEEADQCFGRDYTCSNGCVDGVCVVVSCSVDTDCDSVAGETCVSGSCVVGTDTTCTDTDGGRNYLSPGTASTDEASNVDSCSEDGSILTEYYCDEGAMTSIEYSCNCIDGSGGGYCLLSGSGMVCEAFSSHSLGVLMDVSVMEDFVDEEIQDLLVSEDIAGLTLSDVPVKSKAENSAITGDIYYCGLDLLWHRAKPTVADIACINDPDLDCLSNTACLEDYECRSNSCVDSHCISISLELIAQRGVLTRIWCAVTNLPSFISDGTDSLGYLLCMENPFGGE